jgi:mono/diheme cytochrome c family protein
MTTRLPTLLIGCFTIAAACSGPSGGGEATPAEGNAVGLYTKHCAICHGDDGRKGFAGARALPESALTLEERIGIITRGKGTMMPFEHVLSRAEIEAVARYTLTLQ